MSDEQSRPGRGGPTEFSRDAPPSTYYWMAKKSSRQSPLSINDKAHQLATLLHAIIEQADLLEQVQAMYGEDSIEAASRADLLIGVIQGAKSTVQRHNLTPNGIYKEESND